METDTGTRRIISRTYPGFSTGESVVYLPAPALDQGKGAPAFTPPVLTALKERIGSSGSGNTRHLMSSDTYRQTRSPASDRALIRLRNDSHTSWNTVEKLGPLSVNKDEIISFFMVLNGDARILVEQFDSAGGPLGSRMIKNPDGERKLLTFGFVPASEAASIVILLNAPPQSLVEVEDFEIVATEK